MLPNLRWFGGDGDAKAIAIDRYSIFVDAGGSLKIKAPDNTVMPRVVKQ
jgi:hypothetical protein